MLRHLRKGFVLLAVASCAGVLAAVSFAAPTGSITPYVNCTDGSETVPAGQLIVIRTSWVTSTPSLTAKFMKSQKIEWTLFGVSPELASVLASSGTQQFGSLQSWIDVGLVTRLINGTKKMKVYESLYNGQTAVALAAGQQVRLDYTFQVNRNLDDGLGATTPAGTIYSTSSCLITAV